MHIKSLFRPIAAGISALRGRDAYSYEKYPRVEVALPLNWKEDFIKAQEAAKIRVEERENIRLKTLEEDKGRIKPFMDGISQDFLFSRLKGQHEADRQATKIVSIEGYGRRREAV